MALSEFSYQLFSDQPKATKGYYYTKPAIPTITPNGLNFDFTSSPKIEYDCFLFEGFLDVQDFKIGKDSTQNFSLPTKNITDENSQINITIKTSQNTQPQRYIVFNIDEFKYEDGKYFMTGKSKTEFKQNPGEILLITFSFGKKLEYLESFR